LVKTQSAATVLLEQNGEPLIVSQPYGAGRVTILAFDLWQAPLLHWTEGRLLLADLLSSPPQGQSRSKLLFPVLTTIQTSQAKIAPAFIGLLIYAFIAGPLLYFLLKPKKKGILAWVLIPSVTLLFTLLTPLYSLLLKESDSAYFGATIIESFPGTKKSIVTSDLLVFSGGKESHVLTVQRPNAQAYTVVPLRRRRLTTPLGELPYTELNESGFLSVNPLRLAMWGTRYLSVESAADNTLGIKASLQLSGKRRFELQVTNNGRYNLEDLFVIYPFLDSGSVDLAYANIKKLELGQSETISGIVARGLDGPDKKDLYAMIVKGLVKGHYRQRLEKERTAWVFAKLGDRAYGEGLRTDNNLQLSSWTSIGVAPVEMYLRHIPYGHALLSWSNSKIREETTRRGDEEVHEGTYDFTFTRSTIRAENGVKSLHFKFQSEDKLSVINLAVWEPVNKRWRPLKLDQMQALELKEGEGNKSQSREFNLPNIESVMPRGRRKVKFRYTYYKAKKSRSRPKILRLWIALELNSQ
jgi:hypothetical protein